MDTRLKVLRKALGEQDRRVFDLLMAGVAFKCPNKYKYEVFSHEGDYLADLSGFEVENFIGRVRKVGYNPANVNLGQGCPGFTLAWTAEYQAKPTRWISFFNWLNPDLLIKV